MDQLSLVKQLAINALFWVGVVAIVLSLLAGSLYFLIFFAGLIVFNLVVVNLIAKAQPQALNEIPSLANATQSAPTQSAVASSGVLGFKLVPVAYPKVMDNELRDFAPEFISVNIEQNGVAMFSGSFARDALKQFRDGINQVLNVKSVPTVAVPTQVKQEQAVELAPKEPQVQVLTPTVIDNQSTNQTTPTPSKSKTSKKSKK